MFELSDADVELLRDRLRADRYTVDRVRLRLGSLAHGALNRNETTAGLRITDDQSPLSTLIRLFLLQVPVRADDAEEALSRDLLWSLADAGLIHRYGNEVAALVDIRPYGDEEHDWWAIADLTPGLDGTSLTVPEDHVLGVANSSGMTLSQLTVRGPAERALDVGTGSGVQALHLASHTKQVVATDINARALAMARLTARINGVELELREGNLFEPVRDERFDLIVSSPPLVMSPRTEALYRDGGLAGDEVCRRLVIEAANHLTDGGVCQLLVNWLQLRGEDWQARLRSWLVRTGCDVWIVRREVLDPAQYVELWLKDAGLHGTPTYRERYEEWLEWFEAQLTDTIGFGWITMRRTSAKPMVRIEDWPHPIEQPLGPTIARWLHDVDWLRAHDDDALLVSRLQVAEDVEQEMIGPPGASHPSRIVLRQRRGMCRAESVDTAEAGFVGGCDGSMTVAQIVDAVADLTATDAAELRSRLLPRIRELMSDGFLRPPDAPL